jgi:hypothetical protein
LDWQVGHCRAGFFSFSFQKWEMGGRERKYIPFSGVYLEVIKTSRTPRGSNDSGISRNKQYTPVLKHVENNPKHTSDPPANNPNNHTGNAQNNKTCL